MLVFIGKLALSTHRRVPIWQGFSQFSAFLHHFIMPKVAASSIRVKGQRQYNTQKVVSLYCLHFTFNPFIPEAPGKYLTIFGIFSS